MKGKSFIVLLLATVLCACHTDIAEVPLPVERCAPAPVAITSAASFTFNGKGYIFGGRNKAGLPTNHIYEYDPASDTWTDLGSTPLKTRVRPRTVAAGEYVYMGLGSNGHVLVDTTFLCDWWRWKPATNEWKQLADYPSLRSVGPVIARDGNYIYAAFGGKQNFERWIFRYDIAADSWIQLKDTQAERNGFPPRAHSAAGAWCQGSLFVCSGYMRKGSSEFVVEAEIREDNIIWHERKALQGKRHNATATAHGQCIYLAGGDYFGGTLTTGMLYDDILRYDVAADEWVRVGRMPDGERENMISWTIGNTVYFGLGNDKRNTPCPQLYRIAL